MTNIVETKDLVKIYRGASLRDGDNTAVKGVSFAIRQGEIFGLLGPNGAGKTTTLSMLSCLLTPTSGDATVAGFDLVKQTRQVKKHIGLVPQDLALYPTLSARDNLNFFGSVYGLSGKALHERIDWTLELVGLRDRAKDAVETFSGGMKRRINIAAGLLHKPDILFLDEPTVGIDPQSRNYIFENIERLNHEGLTILYTTHYMEEAERLCHRVAIIDQGQIIALDSPKALTDSLSSGMIQVGLVNGKADALVERAHNLSTIKEIRHVDGKLEIQTYRIQQALIDVLEIANQLDAKVTSLQVFEPNLETVFLRLTGKRLRD